MRRDMITHLRNAARPWIPPAALNLARRRRGTYAGLALTDLTWSDAQEACEGYHDPEILENVERATRQALASGDYERDGIIFASGEVHWLVSGLLFGARYASPVTPDSANIGWWGVLASGKHNR